MSQITDEEFHAALPVLKKLLWACQADKKRIQECGLNVIPANFYSTVPSISEILSSYEYKDSEPPYLNCGIFDQQKLSMELAELIPYSSEFTAPETGDEETCTSFFWKNSQFSYADAMAYYAYIRRIQPQTIFEIGSGFSSLIAVEALKKNGFGKLHCIEPFPRSFITSLSNEGSLQLQTLYAQDITPVMINSIMKDGDILFIDSTHTVKTGSDCLHIYLRLLPQITKKIFVHVHDIFLPFGIPQNWLIDHQIYWTEQYLLLALLIENPKAKLLFGSMYHNYYNPNILAKFMHNQSNSGGGSFWFEYDGRQKSR